VPFVLEVGWEVELDAVVVLGLDMDEVDVGSGGKPNTEGSTQPD